MILLRLPSDWADRADRMFFAMSKGIPEIKKKLLRSPMTWAAFSQFLSLVTLAYSLPRGKSELSMVAILTFFWIVRSHRRR